MMSWFPCPDARGGTTGAVNSSPLAAYLPVTIRW